MHACSVYHDHTHNHMLYRYFLNDLWDTRHVWMAHKPDLMHHIMGVLICSGCIASTAVNECVTSTGHACGCACV